MMKRQSTYLITLRFATVLIACLISITSYTQAGRCDGILIPDVRITNDERAWVRSTVNVFKSNHIETYEDYLGFASHATVPLEELPIPIDVSSSITSNNFKEFRDYLFRYDSTGDKGNTKFNQTIRKLSEGVIKAWENCQNSAGFRIWVIQHADPKTFTLAAIYRGPNNVHLSEVTFSPNKVTTVNDGKFTDRKLMVNKKYAWGNTIQYQTFTRTSNDAITINVNPKESGAGEGLNIQLGPLETQIVKSKIEIGNGELQENSKLTATWGIMDPDPEAAITQNWRTVPLTTSHYHEASWAMTNALTKTLVSNNDFYSWQLEVTNKLGGKSGPNGTGGFGEVTPGYRTVISLPRLKNDSQSFYSMVLKCGTSCQDPSADGRAGIGKKGRVTISGKNFQKSFEFTVDHDANLESLQIDSIRAGDYILEMQVPRLLIGSQGVYFTNTNDPAIKAEAVFITKLSTDITVHEVTAPSPAPKSYLVYYILGAILIISLVIYFIVRHKK